RASAAVTTPGPAPRSRTRSSGPGVHVRTSVSSTSFETRKWTPEGLGRSARRRLRLFLGMRGLRGNPEEAVGSGHVVVDSAVDEAREDVVSQRPRTPEPVMQEGREGGGISVCDGVKDPRREGSRPLPSGQSGSDHNGETTHATTITTAATDFPRSRAGSVRFPAGPTSNSPCRVITRREQLRVWPLPFAYSVPSDSDHPALASVSTRSCGTRSQRVSECPLCAQHPRCRGVRGGE